jgi:hypothetical protein
MKLRKLKIAINIHPYEQKALVTQTHRSAYWRNPRTLAAIRQLVESIMVRARHHGAIFAIMVSENGIQTRSLVSW